MFRHPDNTVYNVRGCTSKPFTVLQVEIDINGGEYVETITLDFGTPIQLVRLTVPGDTESQ